MAECRAALRREVTDATLIVVAQRVATVQDADQIIVLDQGRVAMPAEVGEMARWCALDAPASMTGAVLDVNGASYVR